MDERLDFPATHRNREPLCDVLTGRVRDGTTILEIASGSGQHVAAFAARWPDVRFVPSDPDPLHRDSVAAWSSDLANVAPPLDLDVREATWPLEEPVDDVFCANMIHIAPFACAVALLEGASERLPPGGRLWLYGPFVRAGVVTAPSNVAFDASLRRRDPAWGVRALEDVAGHALTVRLALEEVVEMPANNLFVELVRQS